MSPYDRSAGNQVTAVLTKRQGVIWMSAKSRRTEIFNRINQQQNPLSASALAKDLQVSRQVIVGDVALLRAEGHDIIATARGYMIAKPSEKSSFVGRVVCQHKPEETEEELNIIVDLGATVINVIVEHDTYGEITGGLNLGKRDEVESFFRKVKNGEIKLLSELTAGVHTHTLGCRNKEHFQQIQQALLKKSFLYEGNA